jgi:hypothetical protein
MILEDKIWNPEEIILMWALQKFHTEPVPILRKLICCPHLSVGRATDLRYAHLLTGQSNSPLLLQDPHPCTLLLLIAWRSGEVWTQQLRQEWVTLPLDKFHPFPPEKLLAFASNFTLLIMPPPPARQMVELTTPPPLNKSFHRSHIPHSHHQWQPWWAKYAGHFTLVSPSYEEKDAAFRALLFF